MTTDDLIKTWHQARWIGGSAVAAVVVAFMGAVFAVYATDYAYVSVAYGLWGGVGVLFSLGAGITIFWRRSLPAQILAVNLFLAVVLPISPLGPLICLPWVIAKAPKRVALFWSAGVALVTGLTLFLDWSRPLERSVFTSGNAQDGFLSLVWWGYLLLWLALVALSVGAGLIRKFKESAQQASQNADQQHLVAATLRTELSRKEERELIAREMHDTVAHQLSLISMQAGVLEVTTSDPDVPDSARQMRKSVHRALDEMRSLITSLRDSESGGYTGSTPGFADLDALIAEARLAGAQVEFERSIDSAGIPAPRLTTGVYRIVQESLTNAIKYGSDDPIFVRIFGTQTMGISIEVVNTVDHGPKSHTSGARAGLPGMQERAAMLGGTFEYQSIGPFWRITAKLPWSEQ